MTRIMRIAVSFLLLCTATLSQAADKPNILVVWGDDVGQSNISAYTMGMMGYRTPNIDRIANEGMIFTDYYGEQSCTAGRSSSPSTRGSTNTSMHRPHTRGTNGSSRGAVCN